MNSTNDPVNIDAEGLALDGIDPTTYRAADGPKPGSEHIVHRIGDATYRFVSEETRARFIADPAHHLPEFGGFCAFGVAGEFEHLYPTDPTNVRIQAGRIYLFFSGPLDTTAPWDADPDDIIAKASQRWTDLTQTGDEPVVVADDGLALDGIDPVSYHRPGGPAPGNPPITIEHSGARYLFASDEHRDEFLQAPGDFLPRFGGHCTTSLAQQAPELYPGTPSAFRLRNDSLYLFFSQHYDATSDWDSDPSTNAANADRYWERAGRELPTYEP